jgi:hypothetical protein
MLISVHLPKTAGMSVLKALESHFGGRLLHVHDRPINTPPRQRHARAARACLAHALRPPGGVECIHGHFLPVKYLLLKWRAHARFVTWLREPAQRLVSHYQYCQRMVRAGTPSILQRRVVAEGWSLERFCLCPELRNVYSQFLWGFPARCFEFIGVVEHFEEDFRYFTRTFLDRDLPVCRENVNAEKPAGAYAIDPELQAQIERHHAKDFRLYRLALRRRQSRLGG